jgi:hypothetical protein
VDGRPAVGGVGEERYALKRVVSRARYCDPISGEMHTLLHGVVSRGDIPNLCAAREL